MKRFFLFSIILSALSYQLNAQCDILPTADGHFLNTSFVSSDTLVLCSGDSLYVENSNSSHNNGGTGGFLSYSWSIGNQSHVSTVDSIIPFYVSSPGHYSVFFSVQDDSSCWSTPEKLILEVIQAPIFTLNPIDPICSGDDTMVVIDPSSFNLIIPQTQSLTVTNCLPDLTGFPQETPYFITTFGPGVISSANDISLCLDFEHSYLGDFILEIKCPNGQSVTLHNQQGGGANLGLPVIGGIDCFDNNTYGQPLHYCFDNLSTQTVGDWANANFGTSPVPSGSYKTLDSLSNLEGCPMNGTWTVVFTDNVGGDDGSIHGFSIGISGTSGIEINFPSHPDSSFWDMADPAIINLDNNLDSATILANQSSDTLIYTVINNFGCTYSFEQIINPTYLIFDSLNITDLLCYGDSNGIATPYISNGLGD